MRQIYEYHPRIGFRFIPQIKARIPHEGGGYLVRTNAAGFRSDHEFQAPRSGNARRILLFGDSFTAGEGVSNGQRYSDFLERLVPDLEIYNFGLPATGLDQHRLIYEEYSQGIEHDLLIIAVFVENIRRVGSRFRHFVNDEGERVLYAKPYYRLDGGQLQLCGVPPAKLPVDVSSLSEEDRRYIFTRERFPGLKRLLRKASQEPRFRRWVVDSGLKDRALKTIGYEPLKEYNDPAGESWLVMRALIQSWIRNHPRPVLLMPIPLHHYVYGLADPRAYQRRLGDATKEAGGLYFDPLPALMAAPIEVRKTYYFPGDGHLTKTGNEALALALAPLLRQQLSTNTTR